MLNRQDFFIEYLLDDEGGFTLHLSFAQLEVANTLFNQMKNEWELPVEIQGNRIIILPDKKTEKGVGTCKYSDLVGIHFLNDNHRRSFYAMKPDNTNSVIKIPEMKYIHGIIYFKQEELFSIDFDLSKRELRDSKTLIELNKQFLLNTQGMVAPPLPKKIICYLEYSYLNQIGSSLYRNEFSSQCSLHLTCSNSEDTEILFNTILSRLNSRGDCEMDLENNQVIIMPSLTPRSFGSISKKLNYKENIGIRFCDKVELKLFRHCVMALDKNHSVIKFHHDGNSLFCPQSSISELGKNDNPLPLEELGKFKKFHHLFNLPLTIETLPCVQLSKKEKEFEHLPHLEIKPLDSPNLLLAKEKIGKTISSTFALTAFECFEKSAAKPLMVICVNGFTSSPKGETYYDLLMLSNARFAMPKNLGNGMIRTFGGCYRISNATLTLDQRFALVDLVFISMPNLDPAIQSLNTPCEALYFSRDSYFRHVTSLILMEFILAASTNQLLITGRHGSGIFKNDDDDIAAILCAVKRLPEFEGLEVCLELGADVTLKGKERSLHTIYAEPCLKRIDKANACIESIRKDTKFNLNTISNDLVRRYDRAQITAIRIGEIHKHIDENIIKNLKSGYETTYHDTINTITLFLKPDIAPIIDIVKNEKIKCLKYLKKCIREGLHDGKDLEDIKETWLDTLVNFKKLGVKKKIQEILLMNRKGEKLDMTETMKLVDEFFNQFTLSNPTPTARK